MGTIQSLKTKKLGDLINLAKGKKHTETKDITATRYIQIEDINGSDNLKYTKQKNGIRVYLNNIILVWDGANAGKVGIGLDGIIGSTLARMTIDSEVAYPKFVYWYLNSKFDLIKTQRTGATIPHISQSAIRNLLIPLPPLETQKKIAAILDKADELRQNDKKILQKYEQLAQGVFLEMFGDTFINNHGWEVKTLSEIVYTDKIITYGIVQAGPNILDGIPYIRTGDIVDGNILTYQLLKTSTQIAKSYERSKCNTGDIIMSIRATVGTCAILPESLNGANLTQGTARISVNHEIANPV